MWVGWVLFIWKVGGLIMKSQCWCLKQRPQMWKSSELLEKALAPYSSTLAWKIPWTEEPGRLQSMGSWKVGHFTFTFHFHALEKEMATHSSVLAWRIPGTAEPGALPSMGSHRVGHDWSNLAAAAVAVEKNNRYPTKKIINYKSLFNKVPILSSISKSCIIFSNDGSTNSCSIHV